MTSEAALRQEVQEARYELEQVRRIAAEAMRGMTDQEILELRARLERGDSNGTPADPDK